MDDVRCVTCDYRNQRWGGCRLGHGENCYDYGYPYHSERIVFTLQKRIALLEVGLSETKKEIARLKGA